MAPTTSAEVIGPTESDSVVIETPPTVSPEVTESGEISISPIAELPGSELEYLTPIDEPAGEISLNLVEQALLPGRLVRPITELAEPIREPARTIQDEIQIDPSRQEQLEIVLVPTQEPQSLISGPELVTETSDEVPWLLIFGAISLALLGIGAWRFSGR